MSGAITKTIVDSARAGDKDQFVWDREVKGFGLKVTPTGRKIYILQYRTGGRGSTTKRLTLGVHGDLTPDQARKLAKEKSGIVASGGDPAAERAADKAACTMKQLIERFLEVHVDAHKKIRTRAEYRRLLDTAVLPVLGKKLVRDVTRDDISRLHHKLRATPYQANRVLAVLSKTFSLAEKWGYRPDGSNPCRHVEKNKERERERMLSPDEFARLSDALIAFKGSPHVAAAVRLLIFTGARLSEIMGLQWAWIDFEKGEVRLPDSKTGAKTLHLPPPALAVLADLVRIEGNPYVIVGGVEGEALVNIAKPWRAIRKTAGLDDLRLHDLRHAFASVGASSGVSLPMIGKMLGHSQPTTTARYMHLAADPVKAAAEAIASKIDAAMGRRPSAEVVNIRSAR